MQIDPNYIPEDLRTAIDYLVSCCDEEDLEFIRTEGESQATEMPGHDGKPFKLNVYGYTMHHGYGQMIRNAWLWNPESRLHQWFKATYSLGHADDMSGLIMDGVEAKIQGREYTDKDIMKRVNKSKAHWKKYGRRPANAGEDMRSDGIGDNEGINERDREADQQTESVQGAVNPTVYKLLADGENAFVEIYENYNPGDEAATDTQMVIGATIIDGSKDHTDLRLTLNNGDTIEYTSFEPSVVEQLKQLPPAATLPDLTLPESTVTGHYDPDAEPVQFVPWKSDEPEKGTMFGPQPVDFPGRPTNAAWKDADDVSNTIAVRSSNYGKYVDQAAVELQIKQAFENTPNWASLKPDARCALDMIATKVSRILTGKPDLHDSWHDIQGYSKLIADRIKSDIEAMGGSL